MKLTSKERNFLRKKAHALEPIVRIGKDGVNDNVLESIKNAISTQELIKVKILQNSMEDITEELVESIEKYTKATFIVSIGSIMIFFKEKRNDGKLGEITKEFIDFRKR